LDEGFAHSLQASRAINYERFREHDQSDFEGIYPIQQVDKKEESTKGLKRRKKNEN